MSRNLDRRVEIAFPIEDPDVKDRIKREALDLPFADTVKMRWLRPDGTYRRAEPSGDLFDSQACLAFSRD
jgi:polyphosphate kinase